MAFLSPLFEQYLKEMLVGDRLEGLRGVRSTARRQIQVDYDKTILDSVKDGPSVGNGLLINYVSNPSIMSEKKLQKL